METNEQLQTALLQEAEQAIFQIVEQLQNVKPWFPLVPNAPGCDGLLTA
jgi:hypothetical protein